jgi:hypothetical protein
MKYAERIVHHSSNSSLKNLTVADLTDPGWSAMLSLNGAYPPIYTNATVAQLRVDAATFVWEQYGFNISTSNPLFVNGPFPGTKVLLSPSFAPVLFCVDFSQIDGYAIKVILDTDNLERGVVGDWRQAVFNVLCVSQQTMRAPSGRRAGAQFVPNDAIAYGFFDWYRKGTDLSKHQNREHAIMYSATVGKWTVNERGHLEYKVIVKVKLEDGRICDYVDIQLRDKYWSEYEDVGLGTRFGYDFIHCPAVGLSVDDGTSVPNKKRTWEQDAANYPCPTDLYTGTECGKQL